MSKQQELIHQYNTEQCTRESTSTCSSSRCFSSKHNSEVHLPPLDLIFEITFCTWNLQSRFCCQKARKTRHDRGEIVTNKHNTWLPPSLASVWRHLDLPSLLTLQRSDCTTALTIVRNCCGLYSTTNFFIWMPYMIVSDGFVTGSVNSSRTPRRHTSSSTNMGKANFFGK